MLQSKILLDSPQPGGCWSAGQTFAFVIGMNDESCRDCVAVVARTSHHGSAKHILIVATLRVASIVIANAV